VDKFFKGQSNFEIVLASQKRVSGKVGLGFNPNNKKISISKHFSSFFEKQTIVLSKQLIETCFYYMKMSHIVRFCRVRRFSVSKGVLKWVPKNSKVPNFLINAHGPKFVRGSNLAS